MKILRATLKEVVCSLIVSQNKVCYLIMLFNLFMWIADYLSRADKSAPTDVQWIVDHLPRADKSAMCTINRHLLLSGFIRQSA